MRSGLVPAIVIAAAACGSGGGSGDDDMDGAPGADGDGSCIAARLLWSEDWETGDYARWTSMSYGDGWGNGCQSNGLSTEQAASPTRSHRSEITCAYPDEGNVHRGYGGIQFAGDTPLPAFTNAGTGTAAPFGLVNTFHVWLDSPTVFENGRWFSFWTVNATCDWSGRVLTLGLEDPSDQLAAAHYQPEGTRTYVPGVPGFPRGRWVRITIYVNFAEGEMVVWQDGARQSDVTFARPDTAICQWHWGAYASGDNTDVVLYEDDNSIWKLEQAWPDFAVEPRPGVTQPVCP
jgi:hypothetical protein